MKKKMLIILAEVLWPFIKEHIWPVIKEAIIRLVKAAISKLSDKLHEIINAKTKSRTEEYSAKAQEAEKSAASADNATDVEKYQAIAKIWREVADQLRKDNEELKSNLEQMAKSVTSDVEKSIISLNPNVSMEGDEAVVTMPGEKFRLPPPK